MKKTALIVILVAGLPLASAVMAQNSPNPSVTLESIKIDPEAAKIGVGKTVLYFAMGTYSDYSMADVTAEVIWKSSNEAVATIDSTGLATAVGAGTTSITATIDTVVSNPATITVVPLLTAVLLSNLSVSTTPFGSGEDATICVDVTNTEQVEGSYTVRLRLNDVETTDREVVLSPRETTTVDFSLYICNEPFDLSASYTVEVDGLSDRFIVTWTTNWWLIGCAFAALVLIGLFIYSSRPWEGSTKAERH